MNNKICSALIAATAMTGFFSQAQSASAATMASPAINWDAAQPKIMSQKETGFNNSVFQKYVQSERLELQDIKNKKVNLDLLKLYDEYDVSVYFINEGAGYRNQLGYEAFKGDKVTQSGVLFKDISSAEAIGNWGGDALDLGDGVNIGKLASGTQLDFWLRADGLNRGNNSNIFGLRTGDNIDGLQHAVGYGIGDYLLLGLEDLYGKLWATGQDAKTGKWNESSDRDFNDVVVAVKLGEKNVSRLVRESNGVKSASTPEPTAALPMAVIGALGLTGLRRRKSATTLK
jgi:MYXO-CTERM domain-containing protein